MDESVLALCSASRGVKAVMYFGIFCHWLIKTLLTQYRGGEWLKLADGMQQAVLATEYGVVEASPS
jgi:hypothetical protein